MKPFFAVLLLLLICVAVLALLILKADVSEPFVSGPENVVQGFLASLSTQRYEIARRDLDNDLKDQTSADDLQQLDEALRAKLGEYKFTPGGEEQKQGDAAKYTA